MNTVKNRRTLGHIFAAPVAIGVLSTAGLLAALVGDGWWDAVSWLLLALPVLLYLFFIVQRKHVVP